MGTIFLVYFQGLLARLVNGNHFSSVIGLVSVYICTYVRSCHQFFFVIERTRDLIYLKFVATDFFPKIISPSAGENSGD